MISVINKPCAFQSLAETMQHSKITREIPVGASGGHPLLEPGLPSVSQVGEDGSTGHPTETASAPMEEIVAQLIKTDLDAKLIEVETGKHIGEGNERCTEALQYVLMFTLCGSRKYPYPHHGGNWKFQGGGVNGPGNSRG